MAGFLIYDSANGTSTSRPVVSWGNAPADMIAAQATGPNQIAVESSFVFSASTAEDGGYVYNTVTQTVTFVGMPEPDPIFLDALAASEVKTVLKELLDETMWTQLADAPLTPSEKTQFDTYRADLRNVPNQVGFPYTHTLPTKPTIDEV